MELKFAKRRPIDSIKKLNLINILNSMTKEELIQYEGKFNYIVCILSEIEDDYNALIDDMNFIIKTEWDFAKAATAEFFNTDYINRRFYDIDTIREDAETIIAFIENKRPNDRVITNKIKKNILDLLNYKHLEIYNISLYDLDITQDDLNNDIDLMVAYDNYTEYKNQASDIMFEKITGKKRKSIKV